MTTMTTTWPLTLLVALALGGPVSAEDSDTSGAAVPPAAGLVATQIRQEGFPCDEPSSATRDKDASSAMETVWIIGCKNATYRVRLVPDMEAHIEKLQ